VVVVVVVVVSSSSSDRGHVRWVENRMEAGNVELTMQSENLGLSGSKMRVDVPSLNGRPVLKSTPAAWESLSVRRWQRVGGRVSE